MPIKLQCHMFIISPTSVSVKWSCIKLNKTETIFLTLSQQNPDLKNSIVGAQNQKFFGVLIDLKLIF